ncbi:recombinase family protein [Ensifer adhaerens]|uniref:recombinase family protein n=1 Tax=Ensifer adhaerens TaxID=106592 RepID=UPI003D05C498
MSTQRYIAYYRVSTSKQGQSGLGLEAQRAAVFRYEPIAEFTEIESGKSDDRVELHKALDFAKENDATLIVAKLDRLSRNAAFILTLMERGVRIRCVDMPDADEFQLHLFAILAQKERKMISDRTKSALEAAKNRGVKLGGVQPSRQAKIDEFDREIAPIIKEIFDGGMWSANGIASELNERGIKSPRGGKWQAVTVHRVMQRIGQKNL